MKLCPGIVSNTVNQIEEIHLLNKEINLKYTAFAILSFYSETVSVFRSHRNVCINYTKMCIYIMLIKEVQLLRISVKDHSAA